ncbi:bacterial Ig-like domain protein [Histomonas meleagridis]|uniref:bacterial Ig-like domain protein n=1 Tax=Histomonas meleagridis TaxID=135588 RepID=UPI00355ABFFF|nr:bacterial Ig-like domain protein [Histomonas meleagridis]KAH0804944.1 bacterial Ig-like domain protein [Histomonas meleagridis]
MFYLFLSVIRGYQKIDLSLTIASEAQYGGTYLSWTKVDGNDIQYIAYQKTGYENWEEISTYSKGETINVLHIYPNKTDASPQKTPGRKCLTDKNEEFDMASLFKEWMDGGQVYCPNDRDNIKMLQSFIYNGLGKLGEGGDKFIKVTSVNIDQFEKSIASNLNQYDVIIFGFWDPPNYGIDYNIIQKYIVPFLENDGGFIVSYGCFYPYFGKNEFLNPIAKNYFGVDGMPVDNHANYATILKTNYITLYPYYIGKAGSKIEIFQTHTSKDTIFGKTLIQVGNADIGRHHEINNKNSYLSVFKNTAMFEGGHSLGMINDDEIKLLVNLIHSMKKKTHSTSFIAYSTIDLEPPVITSLDNTSNSKLISWIGEDIGTIYDLKIEAFPDNNIKNIIGFSEVKHIEVITGIKGYYFIIDDKESTEIKGDKNEKFTDQTSYQAKSYQTSKYFHIAAIDRAGNIGKTKHCFISPMTPSPSRSLSPSQSPMPTSSLSQSPMPTSSLSQSPESISLTTTLESTTASESSHENSEYSKSHSMYKYITISIGSLLAVGIVVGGAFAVHHFYSNKNYKEHETSGNSLQNNQ